MPGDDLIGWVGPVHGQRHQRDLAHRQAVVAAGDALGQDSPGHRQPGRADGVRVQGLPAVAGQSYRHDRMVREPQIKKVGWSMPRRTLA